jgi:hypothetical protein
LPLLFLTPNESVSGLYYTEKSPVPPTHRPDAVFIHDVRVPPMNVSKMNHLYRVMEKITWWLVGILSIEIPDIWIMQTCLHIS